MASLVIILTNPPENRMPPGRQLPVFAPKSPTGAPIAVYDYFFEDPAGANQSRANGSLGPIDEGAFPAANASEVNATITTTQGAAIIGLPVNWETRAKISAKGGAKAKNLVIYLPKEAGNITVEKVSNGASKKAPSEVKDDRSRMKKAVNVSESLADGDEVIVNYATEAPRKTEVLLSNTSKRVIIMSDIEYTNITAYTTLENEAHSGEVKLYHIIGGARVKTAFAGSDTNNNGLIDYIEWVVPHTSSQTYEIILITKAEHLNESREFIEDIYAQVKELDGIWSPEIPGGHYVRATFERPLAPANDITVYARGHAGAGIEVYAKNSTKLIASINNVSAEGFYRTLLTGMAGTNDVFDLKIIGGIEFDYIVDPSYLQISFIPNTPESGTSTNDRSIIINVSISASGS